MSCKTWNILGVVLPASWFQLLDWAGRGLEYLILIFNTSPVSVSPGLQECRTAESFKENNPGRAADP